MKIDWKILDYKSNMLPVKDFDTVKAGHLGFAHTFTAEEQAEVDVHFKQAHKKCFNRTGNVRVPVGLTINR